MKVLLAVLILISSTIATSSTRDSEYQAYLCRLAHEELERQYRFLSEEESCTDIARSAVKDIPDAWESVYRGAAIEKECGACRDDRKRCWSELKPLGEKVLKRCKSVSAEEIYRTK